MKRIRVLLAAAPAIICVLVIGGWYFAKWSAAKAFEPVEKQNLEPLSSIFMATLGGTVARGDVKLDPNGANGLGAVGYYQKGPQGLQFDKQFFKTWLSALAIADDYKSKHSTSNWKSSTADEGIPPSKRFDAWGHAFCVYSDQQQTVIVSAGPKAFSSLDCGTLKMSDDELIALPQGRLNPHASGALVLLVRQSTDMALAREAARSQGKAAIR